MSLRDKIAQIVRDTPEVKKSFNRAPSLPAEVVAVDSKKEFMVSVLYNDPIEGRPIVKDEVPVFHMKGAAPVIPEVGDQVMINFSSDSFNHPVVVMTMSPEYWVCEGESCGPIMGAF